MYGIHLISLLLVLSPAGRAEIAGNTYSDPKSGFSISKPKDWEFVKDPKTFGIELKNGGLTAPESGWVVAFTKKMGKDFFGVRPSVDVKQLGIPAKLPLVDWLEKEMDSQKEHDKYYVPVSNAIQTQIEGERSGARAAFINGTTIEGRTVHVYHAIYMFRSKGKSYLINMDCNEDLANKFVDVFAEIAGTVHVE